MSAQDGAIFEQRYPACSETLLALRTDVAVTCERLRCSPMQTENIVLAVNEACMNIVQHGYAEQHNADFSLRLWRDDDVLMVQLLDNGVKVSDADLRPRDLSDVRPGGLGVNFMREIMDTVAYVSPPDGFVNCLQMSRKI